MSRRRTLRRVLGWLALAVGGVLLGAAVGAVAGSLIGESMGSPEGEGFIGFILGMRIGAVAGLIPCGWLAWRRARALASEPPTAA